MRRGPAKPSGKGGVRRKIKMPNVPAVPQQPMHLIAEREPEAEETELHNSCPKCRTRWTPTDVFCRKDGTKLCVGIPCPRCTAPCGEPDIFCNQCGWQLSEKPPTQGKPTLRLELPPSSAPSRDVSLPPTEVPGEIEVVSSSPEQAGEDALIRLRRKAVEMGLIKETVVS